MEKTFLKHCMSGTVPDDSFIIRFKPLKGKDYPYFTMRLLRLREFKQLATHCSALSVGTIIKSWCVWLCQFFLLTTLPSPTLPKATLSSKIPDSVYVSKMPACSFEFCCRAMKIDGL